MRELSLFTGIGGGLLGTKLFGWEHIGYVEINEYCQRVIRARIDDGLLDKAPIFTDVREFVESGAAREYRGFADVVTAGFPCQPFSVAGKQKGEDDERNMWPATIAVIRAVRPRFCLFENVPGLLAHRYFGRILGDLAESGYSARWRVLSAAEVGAPHKRDRVWIVADRESEFSHVGENHGENSESEVSKPGNGSSKGNVSDSNRTQCEGGGISIGTQQKHTDVGNSCWWDTEPGVDRVANGHANVVDRLKALGNGQVPAVVAKVWGLLNE